MSIYSRLAVRLLRDTARLFRFFGVQKCKKQMRENVGINEQAASLSAHNFNGRISERNAEMPLVAAEYRERKW
ncbi:MAG: hypothetical protein H0V39_06065 [Nitrosomonas sp.]|nr:hypothetical protein [Nitrosomonas sp.]